MAMRDDHCYSGNGCLNRAAPPAVVITKPAGIPAWLCAACAAGQVQVRAFHDAMIALFGPTGEVQFEATEHAPPLAELNQGLSPIAAATQPGSRPSGRRAHVERDSQIGVPPPSARSVRRCLGLDAQHPPWAETLATRVGRAVPHFSTHAGSRSSSPPSDAQEGEWAEILLIPSHPRILPHHLPACCTTSCYVRIAVATSRP